MAWNITTIDNKRISLPSVGVEEQLGLRLSFFSFALRFDYASEEPHFLVRLGDGNHVFNHDLRIDYLILRISS